MEFSPSLSRKDDEEDEEGKRAVPSYNTVKWLWS